MTKLTRANASQIEDCEKKVTFEDVGHFPYLWTTIWIGLEVKLGILILKYADCLKSRNALTQLDLSGYEFNEPGNESLVFGVSVLETSHLLCSDRAHSAVIIDNTFCCFSWFMKSVMTKLVTMVMISLLNYWNSCQFPSTVEKIRFGFEKISLLEALGLIFVSSRLGLRKSLVGS